MCARDRYQALERRRFLSQLSAMAAACVCAGTGTGNARELDPGAAGELPTMRIGDRTITRLVAGWNPIGGYSYLGSHTDQHMKEYFTADQTVQFLMDCAAAGINAHQFSLGAETPEILDRVRQQGASMQFFGLHAGRDSLDVIIRDTQPFALAHHGGQTDRLFAEGRAKEVHDYVKDVQDRGLLAGVSAHNPDCIRQIADRGWNVDFFMCCFYYLTREGPPGDGTSSVYETLPLTYSFYRHDPEVMTRVMREVDQPCLGFKILGAGRLCASQETVRAAFQYAFDSIKPSDGVIVGMYPRFFDEIGANARYTREVTGSISVSTAR